MTEVEEVDPSTAVSGMPSLGNDEEVLIQDLDREGLVEHFALEKEAASLREWVEKSSKPRPSGFDARLELAEARKQEGNVKFGKSEWASSIWLYLAALHAIDYSKKDRILDELDESADKLRKWQEMCAVVLSNMAAAFGAKDDNYNAIRAADLGLKFGEKLRVAGDHRELLRAKLLYRRAVAKSRSGDIHDAVKDLTKAVNLTDGQDKAMVASLRKLKKAAKNEAKPFNDFKGKLEGDEPVKTTSDKENKDPAGSSKGPASSLSREERKDDVSSAAAAAAGEESAAAYVEPTIAERRAARRTWAARLRRVRKRLVESVFQPAVRLAGSNRAVRVGFGFALLLAALLLKLLRSHPSENKTNLGSGDKNLRYVVAALVLARLADFYFRRSRLKERPPFARAAAILNKQNNKRL